MIKIAICSDLHLEFQSLVLKNTESANVLILAGDIIVEKDLDYVDQSSYKSAMFHDFFQNCCAEFEHVLYVMGNHCHYHGDIANTYDNLKNKLGYLKNLHILEKETFVLGDVTFVGGTLWTDMNGGHRGTLYHVERCMNDFRLIKNSNSMVSYKGQDENGGVTFNERPSTFSTKDAYNEHKKTLEFIDVVVSGKSDQKFVVVGHHAPSKTSTKPQYEHDTLMNGGYSSDLDFFIEDRPQIKVFHHGHTHHKFCYDVGTTKILCNPRGYANYEEQADNFKLLTYELTESGEVILGPGWID